MQVPDTPRAHPTEPGKKQIQRPDLTEKKCGSHLVEPVTRKRGHDVGGLLRVGANRESLVERPGIP